LVIKGGVTWSVGCRDTRCIVQHATPGTALSNASSHSALRNSITLMEKPRMSSDVMAAPHIISTTHGCDFAPNHVVSQSMASKKRDMEREREKTEETRRIHM
jgi:hypothetical protein